MIITAGPGEGRRHIAATPLGSLSRERGVCLCRENPMVRSHVLITAALLLSACGSGGDEKAAPVQNEIMIRSEAQQQLFQLNDLDRAIALKRAIGDQGLRCAQIVSTGYVTRF